MIPCWMTTTSRGIVVRSTARRTARRPPCSVAVDRWPARRARRRRPGPVPRRLGSRRPAGGVPQRAGLAGGGASRRTCRADTVLTDLGDGARPRSRSALYVAGKNVCCGSGLGRLNLCYVGCRLSMDWISERCPKPCRCAGTLAAREAGCTIEMVDGRLRPWRTFGQQCLLPARGRARKRRSRTRLRRLARMLCSGFFFWNFAVVRRLQRFMPVDRRSAPGANRCR